MVAMRKDQLHRYDDPRRVALVKAVKLMGGWTVVARYFGIKPQAVYNWQVVPIDRCLDIARMSGVSVHELRPDIYGYERSISRRRKVRASDDNARPSPTGSTAEEMDAGTARGGQGTAGARGDGSGRGEGNGHSAQSSAGADISRPGTRLARLFEEAKRITPAEAIEAAIEDERRAYAAEAEAARAEAALKRAKKRSTTTAQCGYGRNSW